MTSIDMNLIFFIPVAGEQVAFYRVTLMNNMRLPNN